MSMKSLKKKLAMLSMITMATVAPVSARAQETKTEPKDMRQEQFDAVLKTAKSAKLIPDIVKDEAIKYIDFPDFIPVTPDGKFDSKTSHEWIKDFNFEKNFPSVKAYLKDLKEGVTDKEAFEKLVENTSLGDKTKKEQLMKFAQPLTETAKTVQKDFNDAAAALYVTCGIILLSGSLLISTNYGPEKWRKRETIESLATLWAMGALGVSATFAGFQSNTMLKKTIGEKLPQVHQAMYDSYVEQAIETGRNKIVMMDMKQAAQMVKFSQSQQTLRTQALKNMTQSVK